LTYGIMAPMSNDADRPRAKNLNPLRALLPFTFWLAYQNAVVARSYVLFTPFAFAAAALLRSPVRRPLAVAAVLGLMANISLHGFVASVGFATAVAFGARREQHPGRLASIEPRQVCGRGGANRRAAL